MRVVIHQPYFLPWLGFFSKLIYADAYVALDDAQFRKRHFQDRVKIISMNGEVKWVGISTGENFGKRMLDVVPKEEYVARIVRTVEYSYARARQFKLEWPPIKFAIEQSAKEKCLSEINILLICKMWSLLFPNRRLDLWRSSTIGQHGDATERIIDICDKLGASEIVFGSGASLSNGVHDLDRLRRHGLALFIQRFSDANISYFQVRRQHSGFAIGVSSIDAVLNIGRLETARLLEHRSLAPKLVL